MWQLIGLGANRSALASCGSSPLHFSAFLGHLKVSRLLVEAGSDPWHRRRADGRTALDLALRSDLPPTAQLNSCALDTRERLLWYVYLDLW